MCARIASMDQLAVKHHKGCVDQFLNSIRAIPYHYSTTDQSGAIDHNRCPLGADSWYKCLAAVAKGVNPPKHPNYLVPEAVKLVLEVFYHYNYDNPFFIDQIADGLTSNHNEALHNVLFTMVPKIEAISYTTMRLGSALAVIRYNGGMGDLSRVFEILGIKESSAIKDLFTELDAKRVRQSRTIHKIQTQRFMDRQSRSRKDSSKRKKHGVGYQSGKFSGSAVISEDET